MSACSSSVKTSPSSAAYSGSPRDLPKHSASKGVSIPRSPSRPSSASRSGWRSAASYRFPEIQFDGFAAPAFDQIVSHLAKYRMRTRGDIDMPVTIRIPSFGGIGAVEHHSESTESYWLHTAGLKVVAPSTPSDAYWLLRQSITSRDPVDLSGTQTAVLDARARRHRHPGSADRACGDPAQRRRRHGDHLRPAGRYGGQRRRTGRRATWLEPGGHRSAIAEPARLRHRRRIGAQGPAARW